MKTVGLISLPMKTRNDQDGSGEGCLIWIAVMIAFLLAFNSGREVDDLKSYIQGMTEHIQSLEDRIRRIEDQHDLGPIMEAPK